MEIVTPAPNEDASPGRFPPQVAEVEYDRRPVHGWARFLIPTVAGGWSLFQLSLPYVLTLNSDIVRAVHLAFAVALAYLCFPARRRAWRGGGKGGCSSVFSARDRIPGMDVFLAGLAALCAAYYALDYQGIAARQGLPVARDFVFGGLLVVLLLEAARRTLGPALPIVAASFIAICFLGPNLPGFIAFKRVSVTQALNQLVLSTEGIYGVPLYVSATTVFLFVLFGTMLEKSGGGRYFVQLAFSLLGRFRGGPAKAAVLASGLTGLVSGSSIANTVTTGTFTIPLMKKSGYPPEKAAAIEVAASTNGQLMPPIMGAAAFIIAERCNIPYLSVVRAAFIPAVISYVALLYITHLEACKLGLRRLDPDELPRFGPTLVGGLHFMLPLGLLIILLFRRFSPEFAAFWATVALVGLIFCREMIGVSGWGDRRRACRRASRIILSSLVAGGRAMTGIGVAVATAGIIVGVMTLGPGGLVTAVIGKLSGGYLLPMLVFTALASLVLGMGLPTTANYIVMSTLTAPAILTLAGDVGVAIPLIAAHLFCFFFGILADDTPPVGLAAYAAAAIARSDPIRTGIQGFTYDMRTALLPFMFIFNTDLLLLNIQHWWQPPVVFGTAVIAMLAFASLVQNWVLTRNRFVESVLLIAVVFLLFRPDAFAGRFGGGRYAWQCVGVLLYGAVWGLQWRRVRAADRPT
ncbi:MAG: TRAP transporter permease [Kiritimatiellaeota bacterium]|nr:TRAP transporter permease [Kiritimatiellota bacterium]